MQTFFSHGKLLITGEYVVLDAALSLALPTKLGQKMEVVFEENLNDNTLTWYSLDSEGETWYREEFLLVEVNNQLQVQTHPMDVCTTNAITDKLCQILTKAIALNPEFLKNGSYVVKTYLEFPNNWGLGSSSTLLCNIAKWAEVDAFELLEASFGGSGYDIAVGMLGGDVLYRSPAMWEGYVYQPSFKDKLYFVHLNQKQDSREGIAAYKSKKAKVQDIEMISDLTESLIACQDFDAFQQLITAHETCISGILEMPTVKEKLFADYPFAIKSLGAWGGDFILACGDNQTRDYFHQKGFETVLSYSELIK